MNRIEGLVFPTMVPPASSPVPNFVTAPTVSPVSVSPKPTTTVTQPVIPQMRRCTFDPKIKGRQHTMILDQIFEAIRNQNRTVYDIDLASLAISLAELVLRMRKTVMEMIYEYNLANPTKIQVMGRASDVPYRGIHNKDEDYLEFNLNNFPDSLVIALYEFILMTKIHQPPPSN